VEGEGFEPSKAEPSDLQSDPFDRSGTPPAEPVIISKSFSGVNEFAEIHTRSFPISLQAIVAAQYFIHRLMSPTACPAPAAA
jgi:hypothetical protein